MVVTYGETDIAKLDAAVIYRSAEAGDLIITARKYCPVCERTIAYVDMGPDRNRWVTFNHAHVGCFRKHYEETGNLLPGVTLADD